MIGIIGHAYCLVRRAKATSAVLAGNTWTYPEFQNFIKSNRGGLAHTLNTVTIDICFYDNECKAYLGGKITFIKMERAAECFLAHGFWDRFWLFKCYQWNIHICYIDREVSPKSVYVSSYPIPSLTEDQNWKRKCVSLGTALSFWRSATVGSQQET